MCSCQDSFRYKSQKTKTKTKQLKLNETRENKSNNQPKNVVVALCEICCTDSEYILGISPHFPFSPFTITELFSDMLPPVLDLSTAAQVKRNGLSNTYRPCMGIHWW